MTENAETSIRLFVEKYPDMTLSFEDPKKFFSDMLYYSLFENNIDFVYPDPRLERVKIFAMSALEAVGFFNLERTREEIIVMAQNVAQAAESMDFKNEDFEFLGEAVKLANEMVDLYVDAQTFSAICEGEKVLDGRLQNWNVKESICFKDKESDETICAKVIGVRKYPTFAAAFLAEDCSKLFGWKISYEEAVSEYERIYKIDRQVKNGVQIIEFEAYVDSD